MNSSRKDFKKVSKKGTDPFENTIPHNFSITLENFRDLIKATGSVPFFKLVPFQIKWLLKWGLSLGINNRFLPFRIRISGTI